MQRRQCQVRPTIAANRDIDRQLSDYTAGFTDGESDNRNASLSTE